MFLFRLFAFFLNGCPVVSAPFVEKTAFPLELPSLLCEDASLDPGLVSWQSAVRLVCLSGSSSAPQGRLPGSLPAVPGPDHLL